MSIPDGAIDKLWFIRKYPDQCCAAVTRNGELEPCDKVAVAVCGYDACDDGEDDPHWWPVCAYHTRKGRMVPLTELFKAIGKG